MNLLPIVLIAVTAVNKGELAAMQLDTLDKYSYSYLLNHPKARLV